MKKYLVLIAAAITLGFTSCGEEDCNHFGEGKSIVSYEDIAGFSPKKHLLNKKIDDNQ